jgi:hypothetical protein
MSACWPVRTEPSRKAVLISLADQANDDGICWPSVNTLAERTCLDERTVQRAIQDLQAEGHLTVQMRSGRSTIYRLHPRHDDTPGTVSPPAQRHHTPVTVTPHPRHGDTQNRKGTIKEPKNGPLTLPEWLPAEVWADWVNYRKSIRKPMSDRAVQLTIGRLAKLREQGHAPRDVVDLAIERGWSGMYAPNEKPADSESLTAGAV